MKISELIETLNDRMLRHGDIEVVATWESIQVDLAPNSIYLAKDGVLYIDADGNSYKGVFAADPSEGES